jgi:DNA repair photolyase
MRTLFMQHSKECVVTTTGERQFHDVVELHASWFAVNPIQGCPKQCGYCFLRSWNQTGVEPHPLTDASAAIAALAQHANYSDTIPVSLLTHTDPMSTPQTRSMLLALIREARTRDLKNPLCFITKCEVPPDTIDQLAALHSEERPIVVYFSLSGLDNTIERGIAHHRLRRGLAQLAAAPMPLIHYFRPILPANAREEVVRDVLQTVVGVARASVLAGFKVYPDIDPQHAGWPQLLESWSELQARESIFPDGFADTLANVRREFPLYPIYDSNLCALSSVLARPDLGGFYATSSCLKVSYCPDAQRQRCASFHMDTRAADARLVRARSEAATVGNTVTVSRRNGVAHLKLATHRGVVTSDATSLRHLTRLPVVIDADARDGYWSSSAAGAYSIEWPSEKPWRGCDALPAAARALESRREALVLREQFRAIEATCWDGLASITELGVQVGHLNEAIYAQRAFVQAMREPGRRAFELADEIADCFLHALLLTVVLDWDARMLSASVEVATTSPAEEVAQLELVAALTILSGQLQESALRIQGVRVPVDRGQHFDSERAYLDDRVATFIRCLFKLCDHESIDLFAAFETMVADAKRFLSSGIAYDNHSTLLELRARFRQRISA